MFTKSFSDWIFNKHRVQAWISKCSSLRAFTLHEMQIERFSKCRESIFSGIQIEDHETLQQNVESIFTSNKILPQELKMHRVNVDDMSSDLLTAFLCERYAHSQDFTSSLRLTNHTLNTTTHFLPETSDAAFELRNEATRLRHAKH